MRNVRRKRSITRIAQPVNKSISATGHSARECPSKTVNTCRKPPSRLELRLLRQLPSRRRDSPQSTSTNSMSTGMLPSLVRHFFAFNCIASIVRIKSILTRPNPTFWRSVPAGVTPNLPRGDSLLPSAQRASQITVVPMPLETSPFRNAGPPRSLYY